MAISFEIDKYIGRYCEVYVGQRSWQQKLTHFREDVYSVGESDTSIKFYTTQVAYHHDAGNIVHIWLDYDGEDWLREEIQRLEDLGNAWHPNVVRKQAYQAVLSRLKR